MIKNNLLLFIIYFGAILLFSCATTQDNKKNQETVISTNLLPVNLSVFNPKSSDEKYNKEIIDLNVLNSITNSEIKNWNVAINNKKDEAVFISGSKTLIKNNMIWDGKNSSNKISPDGGYYAVLTITKNNGNSEIFKSKSFSINTQPPDVNVSVKPSLFSPGNEENNDEVTINLTAKDETGIKNWKINILTPDGKNDFITFKGNGSPDSIIKWDGKNISGELVESAEDYPVSIRVENNIGTVYEKRIEPIHVDILVTKLSDGRYKIKISNILFKENSAVLQDNQKNIDILNMLGKKLKKFPNYNIITMGHVNPFIKARYIEKIGKKLSEDRANIIAKMLIQRGIDEKRISAVGKGGTDPLVTPAQNKQNNKNFLEKNRRVEFYLSK